MAKFKAIYNFQVTEGNKMIIEQALERAYTENQNYLDARPGEIVLTFNSYGMPLISLPSYVTPGESTSHHKERIQQILNQTGLFGYTEL